MTPPRERTLRHLRRALATGSRLGSAAVFVAACGDKETGGVVCDPLPPAVTCGPDLDEGELVGITYGSATWVQGTEGLQVSADLEFVEEANRLAFTADPVLEGGSLVGAPVLSGARITFVFAPDPGSLEVRAVLPVDCEGVASTVTAVFDTSQAPVEGASVSWTVGS